MGEEIKAHAAKPRLLHGGPINPMPTPRFKEHDCPFELKDSRRGVVKRSKKICIQKDRQTQKPRIHFDRLTKMMTLQTVMQNHAMICVMLTYVWTLETNTYIGFNVHSAKNGTT